MHTTYHTGFPCSVLDIYRFAFGAMNDNSTIFRHSRFDVVSNFNMWHERLTNHPDEWQATNRKSSGVGHCRHVGYCSRTLRTGARWSRDQNARRYTHISTRHTHQPYNRRFYCVMIAPTAKRVFLFSLSLAAIPDCIWNRLNKHY